MNNHSLLPRIFRASLFAFLCALTGSASATPAIGTIFDTYCASQPAQATAPQQSRPYRASGSSCLLCHTSANATRTNLNTLGSASLSCIGTTCGAAVNPFCLAHAPSGVSITAPPAGTSVAQGQSLTFTGATATNPDGFTLSYTWLFTGGMPNATGQSVSVPMTVAGSITSTLQVRNSVGMLATGTPPTRTVTVTAGGTLPALTVSPASLSFTAQAGGAAPAPQTLSVASSGAQLPLNASAATTSGGSWLSVAPASSTTPSTLSVSVNPAGLAAGTYNGSVTIAASGASNSPQTVAVTLTVTSPTLPALTVSPASLSFTAQAGGPAPAAQNLSVASSGAQITLNASAATTSGGSWLSVAPASSTTPSTLSVSVNPTGLTAGTYSGSVMLTSAGASNSPTTIAVTLTVTAAGTRPIATIVAPAINVSVLPGGKVVFKGAATDPSNLHLTYRWRFPGGKPSSSSRQNPGAVTFGNPGKYAVTLTVTNSRGVRSATVTRVITVAAPNQSPRFDAEECVTPEHEAQEEDRADHDQRTDRRNRD